MWSPPVKTIIAETNVPQALVVVNKIVHDLAKLAVRVIVTNNGPGSITLSAVKRPIPHGASVVVEFVPEFDGGYAELTVTGAKDTALQLVIAENFHA